MRRHFGSGRVFSARSRGLAALLLAALLSALLPALGATPAQAEGGPPDAALYHALGDQAGIASLMTDLVGRLKADPKIGHFFEHTQAQGLADSLTEQLCAVTHGPCVYKGANMKKAHADLDIHQADFNRLVELLQDTLDAHQIPFHTQNQLLALLAPMYRQMVVR
jgi:hemoglobin